MSGNDFRHIRLNRFLAVNAATSRRKADEQILSGKVKVNHRRVTELGTKIYSDRDVVEVEGKIITHQPLRVYYAIYKPRGYVSAVSDPEGKRCVVDLVPREPRVYPVGRLDIESEGLMILTNDGDFTYRLTHPKHEAPKVYTVQIRGKPSGTALHRLRNGVPLTDGMTAAAQVVVRRHEGDTTWLSITLHEGRNRQIRRMLGYFGYPVLRLQRTAIGQLTLGTLQPGAYHPIDPASVGL